MFEKKITSPLRLSIIGNSVTVIEKIKSLFQNISPQVILIETQLLSTVFSTGEFVLKTVDFMAADQHSFEALEKNNIYLEAPVILFSEAVVAIPSVTNIIFEIIQLEAPIQQLEHTILKLQRVKDYFEKITKEKNMVSQKNTDTSKEFLIKRGKEFQILNTKNIALFYTDNKLTFAFDNNGSKFLVPLTLLELEKQLSLKLFFRANRQYLINKVYINKIRQLEEGRFEISMSYNDTLRIEINQQKFSRLKEWVENN